MIKRCYWHLQTLSSAALQPGRILSWYQTSMVSTVSFLASRKNVFENIDADYPDPERKNVATIVRRMFENGVHEVLPVVYKVFSILATIPATSCSAERSFSALRGLKTYLRSTMGQKRLNSIALINVEIAYANSTLKNDMEKIIDIFGQRHNRKSYFF